MRIFTRWVLCGLCGIWLVGCAGIPGVTGVGYKADSPEKSWDEAKFLEVYGSPAWTHTLPDGRKALYFEYNNAFDSAGWKFVSAAAYAMTLGTDNRVENATSKRLSVILNPDGSPVCADRIPINLAMSCDNATRQAFADVSDKSANRDYWFMMVDIDPREFAPVTFIVPTYHRDSLGRPLASVQPETEGVSFDDQYYGDLYCYAVARWYEGHIAEFRTDDVKPSQARLIELEKQAFKTLLERGRFMVRQNRDFALVYASLQHDLDSRGLGGLRNRAQRCLESDDNADLDKEILPRVLSAFFKRVTNSKNLAQAQAIRDFDLPASTPATFTLRRHASTSGGVGLAAHGKLSADSLALLTFRSEPWLAKLNEGIAAERPLVNTMDSLIGGATYEHQIKKALDQGLEPSIDIAIALASVLSDAIVRSDHEETVRAMTGLARFYLSGSPNSVNFRRAGELFMAASFVAHRMGRFDWSAPLSRFSGDAYILSADQILAEDGLADPRNRDQLREIINFVPYSYEYSDVSGYVWEVEVRGPKMDPNRLFQLVTQLRTPYVNASFAYSYALPLTLDPLQTTVFFENLAARADETFSSAGAADMYLQAANAARNFDEARGYLNQMKAEFANYRANSMTTVGKRSACERAYTPSREAFAEFFGNPSYKQVQALHGKWFRDRLKEYDKKCKYKP
ncbi:MAG: hypothetical protein AAFN07_07280 [Pseudomonadota bacterium]